MKKQLLKWLAAHALLLAAVLPALAQQNLQLSGTSPALSSGKVYLQKFHNKMFRTIDSANIENGKFRFGSRVELPELYGLTFDQKRSPYYIFLEAKPITVQLDSAARYRATRVTGSVSQDIFLAYREAGDPEIGAFIKAHPASIVAAYVLYREWSYRLSPEQLSTHIGQLDPSLQQTAYVTTLKALVPVLQAVQPGNRARDFSGTTPEGRTIRLSDHFGKYVLIDFWASWCPPCRAENPNVVRLFQKYRSKGFSVFGVSLDRDKDSWVKAIRDDKLDWPQVSDLQFWNSAPAKLYGVRAIPANVLIDPNGVIIARNLYGAELEKKLAEVFSAK
ncbi:alkyl hydroperoxide reductase [Pedobacter yulinensis]|uniref:Alkyl hydroperoxide reductase n=1 Tax=Pedobacter yulinensis TaxID=2126353 RepID=A0A2T3HGX9_9SPHI|nr:TlpA disulfide reductase family protein [Pedobacter yulinensis]PST81689.1 alkyl hydroperoxide reductase [Pedobacter yulinensis]